MTGTACRLIRFNPRRAARGVGAAEVELEARNLSTKLFGKTGGQKQENIDLISDLMTQGYSVDDIQDQMRYSGQSSEMSGVWRDAGEAISNQLTADQGIKFTDTFDRKLQEGNITGAIETLRTGIYQTLDTETAKKLGGAERGLELFREIQGDLATLEKNGINTNIFTGTAEDVNKKIGKVGNSVMREVANKIQIAIQRYRQAVSGAAFTESEAKEYKAIFPSTSNTAALNSALIKSASGVFQGDVDFTYSRVLGETTYNEIYDSNASYMASRLIGKKRADGTSLTDSEAWTLAYDASELLKGGMSRDEVTARINKILAQ